MHGFVKGNFIFYEDLIKRSAGPQREAQLLLLR